jgi:hypothetical protein
LVGTDENDQLIIADGWRQQLGDPLGAVAVGGQVCDQTVEVVRGRRLHVHHCMDMREMSTWLALLTVMVSIRHMQHSHHQGAADSPRATGIQAEAIRSVMAMAASSDHDDTHDRLLQHFSVIGLSPVDAVIQARIDEVVLQDPQRAVDDLAPSALTIAMRHLQETGEAVPGMTALLRACATRRRTSYRAQEAVGTALLTAWGDDLLRPEIQAGEALPRYVSGSPRALKPVWSQIERQLGRWSTPVRHDFLRTWKPDELAANPRLASALFLGDRSRPVPVDLIASWKPSVLEIDKMDAKRAVVTILAQIEPTADGWKALIDRACPARGVLRPAAQEQAGLGFAALCVFADANQSPGRWTPVDIQNAHWIAGMGKHEGVRHLIEACNSPIFASSVQSVIAVMPEDARAHLMGSLMTHRDDPAGAAAIGQVSSWCA